MVLTFGQTEGLYVTLNEKRTLTNGYYLFIFTNTTTLQTFAKIYNFSEDESPFPDRYNYFPIITSNVITRAISGLYTYEVYEQAGGVNISPVGLTLIEQGFLRINPAISWSFEEYTGTSSFKAYEG